MSFASEFSDFQSTSKENYEKNVPENREYSDRINYIRSDVKQLKPTADVKSKIRLLPIPGLGYFAKQVRVHFQLGPEKNSVGCPVMKGEECPVCKQSRLYYNASNKDMGKQLSAKTYHLCWVIDRHAMDKGPQLWAIPDTTISQIRNLMAHPETGEIRPLDGLDVGYDIYFTKRKKTASAEYLTIEDIQINPDPSPLTADIPLGRQWLTYVRNHPIESLINYVSKEELEKMIGLREDAAPGDNPSDYGSYGEDSSSSYGSTTTSMYDEVQSQDPKPEQSSETSAPVAATSEAQSTQTVAAQPADTAKPAGGLDMNALKQKMMAHKNKQQQ